MKSFSREILAGLIFLLLLAVGVGKYISIQNQLSALKQQAAPSVPASPVSIPPAVPQPADQDTSDFSGMKEYTDKDFGFSFWYPGSWSLAEKAPAASDNAETYAGGTIAKSIVVAPGKYPDDGISISEFSSDDKSIRDNSNCGPADGCASSIRYYFDANAHLWMKESDFDYGPNYHEPATFAPADISNNSMGGLHIFNGNARFGDDVIVPLSARHFLVVHNISAGTNAIQLLAKTITALDLAVATPVGADEQVAMIRTEGLVYGALGTKVGSTWYLYQNHVYDGERSLVPDAIAASFRPLLKYSDGTDAPGDFATDGVHAWSGYYLPSRELAGADPATFVLIRQQVQSSAGYDTSFQKDKSHVWENGRLIPGADLKTFVVTGNTYQQNSSGGYTLAHDTNHSYGMNGQGYPTVDGTAISY